MGYFVGKLAVQEATRDGRQAEFETPGAVMTAILGAWFGGRLGLSIGLEADSLLAEDKPLEPGHRRGVQLGTVLAGATVTSALGLLHATTLEDGKSRMVAAHALVGAALGAVVQWIGNDRLYPSGAALESNVSVCRDGRIRLGVQLPFRGVGPGLRF